MSWGSSPRARRNCATAPGARAVQRQIGTEQDPVYALLLTNDSSDAETVEIELPLEARALSGGRLVKRDGYQLWRVRVPANGRGELGYRTAHS